MAQSAEQDCQQQLAESDGRIENLEEMLEEVQRNALQRQGEAQEACQQELAESDGRIENLEEMLEEVQRNALERQGEAQEACQQELAEADARIENLEEMLEEVQRNALERQAEAQEPCQQQLAETEAESDARIASLEEMLEEVQRSALEQKAATAYEVAKVRDFYERLLAMGATKTERGIRLRFPEDELRFGFGAADLPEGEIPGLERIAELLAERAELAALIEGHTDSAGPDATNLALSKERAEAVRQALIDRGVPADRLKAEGVGEARPVANNATADGRRQNRRVEVYLQRDSVRP